VGGVYTAGVSGSCTIPDQYWAIVCITSTSWPWVTGLVM
jgi:hypothetical protein